MLLMSMVYALLFAVSLFAPTPSLSHTDVDDTLSQACLYVGPTSSDTLVVSANVKTCAKCGCHSMAAMMAFETRPTETVPNLTLYEGTRAIRSPVYFSHQQRPRVGKFSSSAGLNGTLRHSSASHTQASHTFQTGISLKTC